MEMIERTETAEAAEKKVFSGIGFGLSVSIGASLVLQLAMLLWGMRVIRSEQHAKWLLYAIMVVPQYLVAMLIAARMLKRFPHSAPVKTRLSGGQFARVMLIIHALMLAGNLIGLAANAVIELIAGVPAPTPVNDTLANMDIWGIFIILDVIAPIAEELFFRRLLIDKLRRYGERPAVIFSAVAFACMHTNLSQFFYAFALGLALGYVYVKTGNLLYTIAPHAIINTMGTVVYLFVGARGDAAAALYSLLSWAAAIAGAALLVRYRRRIHYAQGVVTLANWKRTAFLNAGMVMFFLLCAVIFVWGVFNG